MSLYVKQTVYRPSLSDKEQQERVNHYTGSACTRNSHTHTYIGCWRFNSPHNECTATTLHSNGGQDQPTPRLEYRLRVWVSERLVWSLQAHDGRCCLTTQACRVNTETIPPLSHKSEQEEAWKLWNMYFACTTLHADVPTPPPPPPPLPRRPPHSKSTLPPFLYPLFLLISPAFHSSTILSPSNFIFLPPCLSPSPSYLHTASFELHTNPPCLKSFFHFSSL